MILPHAAQEGEGPCCSISDCITYMPLRCPGALPPAPPPPPGPGTGRETTTGSRPGGATGVCTSLGVGFG
eukprot:4523413-Pyramimonas_sp.AAC.1